MRTYTMPLCWAGAILGMATAGATGVIDESSMTALPVAAWMALSGRKCLPIRKAGL